MIDLMVIVVKGYSYPNSPNSLTMIINLASLSETITSVVDWVFLSVT